jgi:hypothetical protein
MTLTVEHTCAGIGHVETMVVNRIVKMNCGCLRHEAIRCDGTSLHHITGAHCERMSA